MPHQTGRVAKVRQVRVEQQVSAQPAQEVLELQMQDSVQESPMLAPPVQPLRLQRAQEL